MPESLRRMSSKCYMAGLLWLCSVACFAQWVCAWYSPRALVHAVGPTEFCLGSLQHGLRTRNLKHFLNWGFRNRLKRINAVVVFPCT